MTDHRPAPARRRYRPFEGKASFALVWSGLFRTILYAVLGLAVGGTAFKRTVDGTDTVSRTFDALHTFLAVLAVVLGIMVIFNIVRFVVGASGFAGTRVVHGTVTEVRRHERGDRLPRWMRALVPSAWLGNAGAHAPSGRSGPRERGCTIVVETDRGTDAFEIRSKLCDRVTVGSRITLSVAGWNRYVRRIGSPEQAGTRVPVLRRFRR